MCVYACVHSLILALALCMMSVSEFFLLEVHGGEKAY